MYCFYNNNELYKVLYLINRKEIVMKRSMLILAACISFIIASLAFITADEPTYKNLKVLKKNISKKDLDSTMHFFAASLGERCTFCHVKNESGKVSDFASDANPNKGTARFMMRMTAKLNKKYFKDENKEDQMQSGQSIQAVTCYTCHHGQGHPAVKPASMPGNNMGTPPHDHAGDIMRNASGDSAKIMSGDSSKGQH